MWQESATVLHNRNEVSFVEFLKGLKSDGTINTIFDDTTLIKNGVV